MDETERYSLLVRLPYRLVDQAMLRCLELARRKEAEVPVGALLMDLEGRVLAESGNQIEASRQALDHAECLLLREGARINGYRDLRSYVLVSSLEPCQMCTEACLLYRIGGVIFGAYNLSKKYPSPESWIGGVKEVKASALLRQAFEKRRLL